MMPTQVLLQAAAHQHRQQQPVAPLQPFAARTFPVQAYAARLPEDVAGQQLQACLDSLLAMAQKGAAEAAAVAAGGGSMSSTEEPFSYNVLLTREWALLVPRSQETAGPCAIK
jgi:ATP adenylyltransferase/5',5'''-P-1,P-4-tetraphosphate phosphorylase II